MATINLASTEKQLDYGVERSQSPPDEAVVGDKDGLHGGTFRDAAERGHLATDKYVAKEQRS